MAYDEKLADRVREALSDQKKLEEKKMFRGLCFMVNGKMCVCVSHDELMCRVGPERFEEKLEMKGIRPMVRSGTTIEGYVYVAEEGYKSKKDFDFWIAASLAFNKDAKSSRKKAPKKKSKPIKGKAKATATAKKRTSK
jgi:TfoX/Sxy family transcriptional regulator of competence genes